MQSLACRFKYFFISCSRYFSPLTKVVREKLDCSLMTWKIMVSVKISPMNSHSPIPTVSSTVAITLSTMAFADVLLSYTLMKSFCGISYCACIVTNSYRFREVTAYSGLKTISQSSRRKKRTNTTIARIDSCQTMSLRKVRFCSFLRLVPVRSLSAYSITSILR